MIKKLRFEKAIQHLLLFAFLVTSGCKKDSEDTGNGGGGGGTVITDTTSRILYSNTSTLVSNLNGFRFDGSYTTLEPVVYPYLYCQYVDDYYDSTRVVMVAQNSDKTITKYLATNTYNALKTRSFSHGTYPNDHLNDTYYSFHHPNFLLYWFVRSTGELTGRGTLFGMNTSESHTFTGMQAQYKFEFLSRYLIRYISGISIWPFHYYNWSDEAQFVATQELSDPKATDHYYDETFSTFPYDVKSNIYSGFFNSTNTATYVGISKGVNNLDTFYLNNNSPTWYDPNSCQAFLDKSGDTLYFGLIKNVPPSTMTRDISLYRLVLGDNECIPLYQDIPYSYTASDISFHRGKFYIKTASNNTLTVLNQSGIEETLNLPVTSSFYQLKYSKNKIFTVCIDGSLSRIEIYSKDY